MPAKKNLYSKYPINKSMANLFCAKDFLRTMFRLDFHYKNMTYNIKIFDCIKGKKIMKQSKFPPGWDEKRVREVLEHYETQSDEEAVAEDEAAYEERTQTFMEISNELVPKVRELLAHGMSEKATQNVDIDDIRPEYDFSKMKCGVRGKYYKDYRKGHTVKIHKGDGTISVQYFKPEDGSVMIDPDIREYFPDSESVNKALRCLIPLVSKKPN